MKLTPRRLSIIAGMPRDEVSERIDKMFYETSIKPSASPSDLPTNLLLTSDSMCCCRVELDILLQIGLEASAKEVSRLLLSGYGLKTLRWRSAWVLAIG